MKTEGNISFSLSFLNLHNRPQFPGVEPYSIASLSTQLNVACSC